VGGGNTRQGGTGRKVYSGQKIGRLDKEESQRMNRWGEGERADISVGRREQGREFLSNEFCVPEERQQKNGRGNT